MAVDFLCKACRGILNVKTSIIISATKINSTKRGLVYLNPELGNYTNTTHPSFGMEDGAEYLLQLSHLSLAAQQCEIPPPGENHSEGRERERV